jgi:hypothetical protein
LNVLLTLLICAKEHATIAMEHVFFVAMHVACQLPSAALALRPKCRA